MLEENKQYSSTVVVGMKTFHNVELCILKENIENVQNMILTGNIFFTLKPTTKQELESLFSQLYGVPQREVKMKLLVPEINDEIGLLIKNSDDKIYSDYLTINGVVDNNI